MRILQASDWNTRQESLARAYKVAAQMHNALGITIPLKEKSSPYFGRPYLVIGDERHVAELRKSITSDEVKNLRHKLGSVKQWVDSDDKLNDLSVCSRLKELYA